MTTAVEARTDLAHCVIAVECRGFGEKFVQAVEIVFFVLVSSERRVTSASTARRTALKSLKVRGARACASISGTLPAAIMVFFSSGSRFRAVGGGGGDEAEVGVAVALEGHGECGAGPDRGAGSEAAR